MFASGDHRPLSPLSGLGPRRLISSPHVETVGYFRDVPGGTKHESFTRKERFDAVVWSLSRYETCSGTSLDEQRRALLEQQVEVIQMTAAGVDA